MNEQDLIKDSGLRNQLKDVLLYNLELNTLKKDEIKHYITLINQSLQSLD
jgi:hypothetical protein